MSDAIDTSVLLAAMVASEPHHAACDLILNLTGISLYAHGLTEAFSTLTGGRHGFRMRPALAAEVLAQDYATSLKVTVLTPAELLRAFGEAENRGVRGGAVFDFLHLVAARKAGATRLFTLNLAHFRAFHRLGDPVISHPGETP